MDELRAAILLGLVQASKQFDPQRGIPFGGYAQFWIKGEILELFKPDGDALGHGRATSLNGPIFTAEDDDGNTKLDLVIDESSPVATVDVSDLNERVRLIFEARLGGETLDNLGRDIGISRERVRQINEGAVQKVRSKEENVKLTCIRDLLDRQGYRKPSHLGWAQSRG